MIIISIIFLSLAVMFYNGQGAFLIAGYNTMPESEKAEYDELAVCKLVGKTMCAISLSLLLIGVGDLFEKQTLEIIGLIFLILSIGISVIYPKNKLKKNV